MNKKIIQLCGALIELPVPGSDEYPRIILENGTEIRFDIAAKRTMLDWGCEDEAVSDIRGYANDIRNGSEERYDEITADDIEENIEEIMNYYLNHKWNSSSWNEEARSAVDSFADSFG